MQVKLSVIKHYLQSATALYPSILFLSIAGCIASQVSTNIWLSKWTLQPVYNGTTDRHTTDLYLGVYGALGAFQSMLLLLLSGTVYLRSNCVFLFVLDMPIDLLLRYFYLQLHLPTVVSMFWFS